MEKEEHAVTRMQLVKSRLETLQEKVTQFLQVINCKGETEYKSTEEEERPTDYQKLETSSTSNNVWIASRS